MRLCSTFGTSRVAMRKALFGLQEILAGDSNNKTAESWYGKACGWQTDQRTHPSSLPPGDLAPEHTAPWGPPTSSPSATGLPCPAPTWESQQCLCPLLHVHLASFRAGLKHHLLEEVGHSNPFLHFSACPLTFCFFVCCLFHQCQLHESRDLFLSISLPPVPRKLTCSRNSAYI